MQKVESLLDKMDAQSRCIIIKNLYLENSELIYGEFEDEIKIKENDSFGSFDYYTKETETQASTKHE